jgi:hypothetical protein
MNDPVAHLKQQYPYPDAVVDEIYTTISLFAGEGFVAVNYTEKCLRRARMFNCDPLDEMRATVRSWKAVGNPIQVAQRGAAGLDPFSGNPEQS